MLCRWIATLSLMMLTTLVAPTRAQDAATAEVADKPAAAEAQAAYDRAQSEYKPVFSQIETLRGEYQSAGSQRRKEINAELMIAMDTAREKMANWTAAALDLYRAAPNENEEVSQLLVAMAKHFSIGEKPPKATGGAYFGGDQYEQALPIAKALIEGGHPEKDLLIWGGVSAVCVGDFQAAKQYLTAAGDAGLLSGLPPFPQPDTPADVAFKMKARDMMENFEQFEQDWKAEQAIRAAEAQADNLPRVKFTTTKGDVVIELFEDQAPIATANIISLVKDDFYSDVVFHRVLPHFMAQGGDPTGTGSGGPGHNIACECYEPDARKHFRGTLSMAHAGRDTGGSQFFMCFVPTDFLNGRHTAFGRVVEGMEVLGKLQRIDPNAQGPFPTPDKIIKAEVLRDRGHAYDFEKLPER